MDGVRALYFQLLFVVVLYNHACCIIKILWIIISYQDTFQVNGIVFLDGCYCQDCLSSLLSLLSEDIRDLFPG